MAFCRIVFPLLVLCVISCYASNVPVIIWGNLHGVPTKADRLTSVSEDEFKTIVEHVSVDDPLTAVFVEETLSVEDFSQRNEDGETFFPYLQGIIHGATYLPSVQDPLHVLNTVKSDHLELTQNGLSGDLTVAGDPPKFLFINLKDAKDGESRQELLRRHDRFMQDTMSELQKKYGDVIAIYTAAYPSWIISESHSRVRRATGNASVHELGNLRLSVKSITLENQNASAPLTNIASFKNNLNVTTLDTEIVFENNIKINLNFYMKGGYWFFESVTLTNGSLVESLMPVGDEVFAIEGFSYRCAQHVAFASVNQSNNYAINFQNLKIQPFFQNVNETTPQFGDSFNCVGFFTAPIWAGLFVVFILLSITFFGIMMMMDIRTMDRFDDPKGKTITINAE